MSAPQPALKKKLGEQGTEAAAGARPVSAAAPIPPYLLVSFILSGLLTATFLTLFGFSLTEAALGDPSIWVTLSLGTGGVFGTSLMRFRDLRRHAV